MTIERITFDNERDWLEARTKDITSTDVAALPGLNLSPYLTPFELWHRKRDGIVPEIAVNERMRWGTRLQDAIARGVAEDEGLNVRRLGAYIRDVEARIGSSFDFEVISHADGPGIMEVKTVDGMAYKNTWSEEGDQIEAPAHIELQLQHQLEITGRPWGMIVALVGGNTIKKVRRERDEEIGAIIRMKVAEFWATVALGTPPPADYSRDADAIIRLYRGSEAGKMIDLSDDAEASAMAIKYQQAQSMEKAAGQFLSESKARLLEKIGDAEKVLGKGWTISAKSVADNPGTLITEAMVGTRYGARKGYRGFRFQLRKEA